MNKFSKIIIFTLFIFLGFHIAGKDVERVENVVAWREDFSHIKSDGLPVNWKLKTLPQTPATSFKIVKNKSGSSLLVEAKQSTGSIVTVIRGVDLNKTPVLRWRWKAENLPRNADGRQKAKDDQVLAIYVGVHDGFFGERSIAYRWETETPLDFSGKSQYCWGVIKVTWFCLKNKSNALGKWHTEERDIAKDFKKIFGFVPKSFALSIAANSQHTNSSTTAAIKFLELVP